MKHAEASKDNAFKRWCVENGHASLSIAEKVGISRQAVYSYMEGRRSPSPSTQKRFEEVYKVNSRELFPL